VEHPLRPVKHERLTAAEPSRAGRTFPGVAGIERAVVLRIEGVLNRGAARAPLEEASEAATSGNKATAVVRAVRAWAQEVVEVSRVEAVVAAEAAAGGN
jgi:hypothetical protein